MAALEALADHHEACGPCASSEARITYQDGRKVRLYISRAGSSIVGSHRTGGQYAHPIEGIDRIQRIEYGQNWLRDEHGPLFVAEEK